MIRGPVPPPTGPSVEPPLVVTFFSDDFYIRATNYLLLLGPHAVVVKPVDDGLGSNAELGRQLLEGGLVGVGVFLEGVAQRVLLLVGEEDATFLGSRRRRQRTVAQLVVRVGRRALHARCTETQ